MTIRGLTPPPKLSDLFIRPCASLMQEWYPHASLMRDRRLCEAWVMHEPRIYSTLGHFAVDIKLFQSLLTLIFWAYLYENFKSPYHDSKTSQNVQEWLKWILIIVSTKNQQLFFSFYRLNIASKWIKCNSPHLNITVKNSNITWKRQFLADICKFNNLFQKNMLDMRSKIVNFQN